MPNAAEHARIGAVTGAATCVAMATLYKREPSAGEVAICSGVGLFTAGFPDLIEPAISPRHRSSAHSVAILVLIVIALLWYCTRDTQKEKQFAKMLAASAAMGYISHLLADSCTPSGLPMFS